VAESTPSLKTARLPDDSPAATLTADSIAFPIVLAHEAFINMFSESCIFFLCGRGAGPPG
jgi:hypothetical protein